MRTPASARSARKRSTVERTPSASGVVDEAGDELGERAGVGLLRERQPDVLEADLPTLSGAASAIASITSLHAHARAGQGVHGRAARCRRALAAMNARATSRASWSWLAPP